MQASVHTFDPDTGAGEVVLDTGTIVGFAPDVFHRSTLLHLRLGQRVSIETGDEISGDELHRRRPKVTRLWIVGIGHGEAIR